jgi:hypothetical protein
MVCSIALSILPLQREHVELSEKEFANPEHPVYDCLNILPIHTHGQYLVYSYKGRASSPTDPSRASISSCTSSLLNFNPLDTPGTAEGGRAQGLCAVKLGSSVWELEAEEEHATSPATIAARLAHTEPAAKGAAAA